LLAILLVTFPFFALVLCGYLATWRGYLPLPAIAGLQGEEREGRHQHQDEGDTQCGQEPHSARLFCHF